MKLKLQPRDSFELFQAPFDQILNPGHELIRLACKIDWPALDAAFADCYRPELGAPAKAVRLVVGLHYAKYAFDESDESVVARWIENPYWQYFCGYMHMQCACPIHPTSMTKCEIASAQSAWKRCSPKRLPWPRPTAATGSSRPTSFPTIRTTATRSRTR